jgi:hypothetical protein
MASSPHPNFGSTFDQPLSQMIGIRRHVGVDEELFEGALYFL